LSQLRLREVLKDLDEILILIIMDYSKKILPKTRQNRFSKLCLKIDHRLVPFAKVLGYDVVNSQQVSDTIVRPRGYRILKNEVHIPMNISQNVIKSFRSIDQLVKTNPNVLQKVEGIGDKRARAILRRLREIKKRRQ